MAATIHDPGSKYPVAELAAAFEKGEQQGRLTMPTFDPGECFVEPRRRVRLDGFFPSMRTYYYWKHTGQLATAMAHPSCKPGCVNPHHALSTMPGANNTETRLAMAPPPADKEAKVIYRRDRLRLSEKMAVLDQTGEVVGYFVPVERMIAAE